VENIISREVSSSLPAVEFGLRNSRSASKLKLPGATALPQSEKILEPATLTPIGRVVKVAAQVASQAYAAPRLWRHAGVVMLVGGVVLSGSAGHTSQLSPVADQAGYSSVLDQSAETNVAAAVAQQTDLLITPQVSSTAKTLNSQVSLPTSDDGTLASQEEVNTTGAGARGTTTYTVQAGDTLASIATEFDVTSGTIMWANNLTPSSALTPGQQLTILPISGVQYTVVAGDTAQSVATHFQANADQILAFNNDQSSGLQPGQAIIVPDGVLPQAAQPAATVAPAAPAGTVSASQTAVHAGPGSIGNSYAFGYCTWYVATKRSIPGWWGNAIDWYSNAQISGYSVGTVPRVGAIAWSGAGYYGHVAYVEAVNGDNVTVSEMNWDGGWDRVDFRTTSASSFRYIY
jgi:surface antigen